MKTRDRILVTSLALFNDEGEAHTTTIDIANELDISPGNLYYHFKGKDEIIAELYQQYELAMADTLHAPITAPLGETDGDIEANWYYLYVLFEEMYQYRFLYQNLDDILQRYPDIRRRFKRLVQLKRSALSAICLTLLQQRVLQADEDLLERLVDNLTLTLNYWINYDQLLHTGRDPQVSILQGVLQIMTAISPYLGEDSLNFYEDCREIYQRMMHKEPN